MTKKAEFLKLKDLWYKKLEKSGFVDIERDEQTLKRPLTSVFGKQRKAKNIIRWRAKQDYFYMAEHFLNNFKFKNKFEENVWMYHANGLSLRNITKVLNKVKRFKTNRTTVWKVIKDHEVIMKKLLWAEFSDGPVDEQ